MDEYLSEKEQVEEIKKWWNENGRFIITGASVGLLLLFGWRYLGSSHDTRAAEASGVYATLLEAVDRSDRTLAQDLAAELSEQHGATSYADLAGLAMARLHVEAAEQEQAATRLEQVLERQSSANPLRRLLNGSRLMSLFGWPYLDAELAHVARLRLARLRIDQGQPEAAVELLERSDVGRFASRYHEVRGDAFTASGDSEGARVEYRAALDTLEAGLGDRGMLQMKLDALQEPAASEPPPAAGQDS